VERRGGFFELSDTSDPTGAVDARAAALALDDVSRFERKTREALTYADCAVINFLWAGISSLGYVGDILVPRWSDSLWFGFTVFGLAATFALAARIAAERRDSRPVWVTVVVTVFSYFWFALLFNDATTSRDAAAFFPMCYMLGILVMGFWIGRLISFMAAAISGLILLVYATAPDLWFSPLMIVCVGGGLTVSGLIMRRIGSRE